MKLPSIERLLASALLAARRFPLAMLSALVAAAATMVMVDRSSPDLEIRLAAAASLGLPLFTGITLVAERHRLRSGAAWLCRLAGVGLLALFFWRWPSWSEPIAWLRYFHLSVTLHLAVAVGAYLGVREPNGFWQFNRALFLRFLIAGVYSGVLFAGLALALAGVDNLLGFDVDDEQYARLFFLLGFVFQTWFFLAGVPERFDRLEASRDYPVGLRVFAQYVLLPLVSVYLVILTAYLGRVLVTRTWPSGWIGFLVSALAALGILSLLLVHPEREREDQPWIDRYARLFWFAILPAVAMLLLAIGQRIGQYGITERRYLLLALALWLAAIALFYAISRSRRIEIIPISLGLLGIVTWLGPQSAYDVSERSQVGRLAGLLETHGVLVGGRVTPSPGEIPAEDWRQVHDAIRYLIENHGTDAIDPWFEGGLAAIDTLGRGIEPAPRWESGPRAALIVAHLGLEPAGGPPMGEGGYTYFSAVPGGAPLRAAGYDWVIPNTSLLSGRHVVAGDTIELRITPDPLEVVVRRGGVDVLRRGLDPILRAGMRGGVIPSEGNVQLPLDSLRVDLEAGELAARIYIEYLTLQQDGDSTSVPTARGTVLLRLGG